MNKHKLQQGVSTFIVVLLVVLLAIFVGGVFYFIGSQKNRVDNAKVGDNSTANTEVSGSTEDAQIQKQIDDTAADTPDADLSDVEKDAASFK